MLNINAVHKEATRKNIMLKPFFHYRPCSQCSNQSQCYSIEAINSHFILLRFSSRHNVVSTAGRSMQRVIFIHKIAVLQKKGEKI